MKFTAYERTVQGTGASRRLRNAQKVPGIVYGAGTPAMIELDHNALFFALKKEAFASPLPEFITVDLGNLTKGQSLHVSDIELPAGTKVVTHGKPNPVIVSANVQAAEVEEVAPAPVVAAAAPAPTKA